MEEVQACPIAPPDPLERGPKSLSGPRCCLNSGVPDYIDKNLQRVIWGSTTAPTEMELELQLTAVGLRLTAVGLRLTAVGLHLTAVGLQPTPESEGLAEHSVTNAFGWGPTYMSSDKAASVAGAGWVAAGGSFGSRPRLPPQTS